MHGDSKPRPNKPRGITEEGYAAQNPWHDRAKDKPVFSLGEPLPHSPTVDDGQHQGPSSDSEKPKYPNFSLGEPLPHKVRKHGQHSPAADDVEQGLSQKPTQNDDNEVEKPADKGHNTPDTEATITQHPTRNEHPHDDEQGTEMAHRFQVDADRIGGRREDDAVEDGQVDPNAMRNKWARIRAKYPEPLAEFLCTAMSVFLGLTGTLSVNLSQGQTETGEYGTYETLCWAWGFAFMFGIYLGGGVSGAHMNPAISVSLSLFRGFPWRRCAVYVAVQILAAFAGGALAYGLYYDAIQNVDPTLTQTYTSFITVPKPWVTPATAFFSEFLGGAVIMIAVLSLGDDQNNPPGAGMHALILGLLVTTLKMTLGYNTGAALSPASDLGPRLVAYAAGYRGPYMWSTGFWAYGPWAGTLCGAVVGCTMYDAVVFVGSESPVNYRWSKERHALKAMLHKGN